MAIKFQLAIVGFESKRFYFDQQFYVTFKSFWRCGGCLKLIILVV